MFRNEYVSYAASFVAGAAVASLVYAGWIVSTSGNRTPDIAFLARLMALKADAADSIEKERLMVVAGSGSLFGVRSDILEKSLSVPVVNLSLHGGLGPAYISHFAKRLIRPGDHLLVLFEYPLLTGDTLVNDRATFVSWARRDGYWETLGFVNKVEYFRSFTSRQLIDLSIEGSKEHTGERLGPWRIGAVSKRGDLTAPTGNEEIARDQLWANMRGDRHQLTGLRTELKLSLESPNLQSIADLVRYANGVGAKVYATWPVVTDRALYHNAYKQLIQNLPNFYESIGAQFITTPNKGFVPESWLFDTAFHLNAFGSERWTGILTDALCRQAMECPNG